MSTPRKKILYVITKSNWGGAQRYVYDLATAYAPDYDVVVALGGDGPLKKRLIDAGIRTLPIESLERDISFLKELRAARALWQIIRSESPDIIHLNSSKAGGLGTFLARIAGVPRIIFTAHGWAFNEPRPFLARAVLFLLHWMTVLLSHVTIAVSKEVKRQISRALFVRNKVHVVHLGIRASEQLTRNDARNKLATLTGTTFEGKTVIGTIAELHPVKNYPMALSAFSLFAAEHPHSVYLIMGDGEARADLEKQAQKLGIGKSVHFLGFVPNAATLLGGLDTFLLTSHSEAFGYVLLEAGCAEVPVIATNVGGIPEIITDKVTGLLVQPGDVNGAAQALATLATSTETSVRLGNALAKKVTGSFGIEEMVHQTEGLYK